MKIGPRSRRADGGIREFWVSLHDGAGDELSYPKYERVLVVWGDDKWRHGTGTVDEHPVSFVPVIARCHDAEAFGVSTTARGEPEFLMTLSTPISLDWDKAGIAVTPQVVHPSAVYDVLRWLRVPEPSTAKRRPAQKRKRMSDARLQELVDAGNRCVAGGVDAMLDGVSSRGLGEMAAEMLEARRINGSS